MTIEYHVYSNGGSGPVNYGTIVATTSTPTYTTAARTYPDDWIFAVRAYDTVSAIEETNTDARCELDLNAAGADVSAQPNAPIRLTVYPSAGGKATVVWSYAAGGQGGAPTGFHIYIGTPTVSYTSPVLTTGYSSGIAVFSATLTGLTAGATYQVGVRAYNGTAEETNTVTRTFTEPSGTAPLPVVNLTGTAVP